MPNITFTCKSASIDFEHGPLISGPIIHVAAIGDDETQLISSAGELLHRQSWTFRLEPADDPNLVDEQGLATEAIGEAHRLLKRYITCRIQLPRTLFDKLEMAVLSGRPISGISLEIEAPSNEDDSIIYWNAPDESRLPIESATVTCLAVLHRSDSEA